MAKAQEVKPAVPVDPLDEDALNEFLYGDKGAGTGKGQSTSSTTKDDRPDPTAPTEVDPTQPKTDTGPADGTLEAEKTAGTDGVNTAGTVTVTDTSLNAGGSGSTKPTAPVVVPPPQAVVPTAPEVPQFNAALYNQLPQQGAPRTTGKINPMTGVVIPALTTLGLATAGAYAANSLPDGARQDLLAANPGLEFNLSGDRNSVSANVGGANYELYSNQGVDNARNLSQAGLQATDYLVNYGAATGANKAAEQTYQNQVNQIQQAANQALEQNSQQFGDGTDLGGMGQYGQGGTFETAQNAQTSNAQGNAAAINQQATSAMQSAEQLRDASTVQTPSPIAAGAGAAATLMAMLMNQGGEQSAQPQAPSEPQGLSQEAKSQAAGQLFNPNTGNTVDDYLGPTYAGDNGLSTNGSLPRNPYQGDGTNPLVQYYGPDSLDSNPRDGTADEGGSGRSGGALEDQQNATDEKIWTDSFNDYRPATTPGESNPTSWFNDTPSNGPPSNPYQDGEADRDVRPGDLKSRGDFLVDYRRSRLPNQEEEDQRRRRRMTRWDENARV